MNEADGARMLIEKLAAAWNQRDWAGFVELFADDADYVTAAGTLLSGRSQIRTNLSARANEDRAWGEVRLAIETLKMLRPDVAVVLCRWQMSRSNRTLDEGARLRAGLLTLVTRESGGGWRVIALHNTDRVGQSESGAA